MQDLRRALRAADRALGEERRAALLEARTQRLNFAKMASRRRRRPPDGVGPRRCPQHEDAWVGWADAKGVKGGGKISKGGQSFADIRKQEKREAAGTETRAKQRNETGGRGNVFGFDNRRGIKGVVSKETERKDPNAFKGVDASAVRRAAQGPAGPVRGSQTGDADELRRKRMARFGGGAATATRP